METKRTGLMNLYLASSLGCFVCTTFSQRCPLSEKEVHEAAELRHGGSPEERRRRQTEEEEDQEGPNRRWQDTADTGRIRVRHIGAAGTSFSVGLSFFKIFQ